jgi:hypothetical protein
MHLRLKLITEAGLQGAEQNVLTTIYQPAVAAIA